jgi:hypothetical protein
MQSAVGTGFTFCDFSRGQIASHLSVASSCLGTGTTTPPPPSSSVPARPTNATASAVSASQINLTWSDNSSDETGFKIERMTGTSGAWSQIAATSANARSYSDTGLLAATLYQYRVRAYNGGGDSSYSNDTSAYTLTGSTPPPPQATPPAAPSNASAAAASSSQINLFWSDNSSDESGFKIERKTGASGSWSQVATTGANTTGYADVGLAAGATYVYRVRAYNGAGDSAYTNETSATTIVVTVTVPSAPSGLSASLNARNKADLSWSDNSGNESGFVVERSESGAAYQTLATVGAGSTSYRDSGLRRNRTYVYRVRAFNDAGSSGYSNTASVQP